ncbi:MAG: FAD-linked oxidase C-terminal domain-containing protein [Planctomycetota bacterium]
MTALPVLPSTPPTPSDTEREAIGRDLANAVRGEVRFGLHDRMLYATDASIYQVEPLGVVVPESIEDAMAAVAFCAGRSVPMLPRGGGTSLAGQAVGRSVVIDLSASSRAVRSVDAKSRSCEVDAGITLSELNRHLEPTGLLFAPDPSTVRQATVGGCIGNNAAGTRSIKYGRTAENLLGVDAVLASGLRVMFDRGAATRDPVARRMTAEVVDIVRRNERLIRERFPKTLRRNAAYALDMILAQLDEPGNALENVNLAHLLCGSEGTLAMTVGANLKLHPIPTHRALGVLGFTSVDEAIAMVEPLLAVEPAAVELLDDLIISTARRNIEYGPYVDLMPQPAGGDLAAVLYVELLEQSGDAIEAGREKLRSIVGGAPFAFSTDAGDMAKALKLRQAGEPLLHAIPGERKPLGFVEDNAVPVERLGEFVRGFRSIVESHGTRASFYAHASVGVLHVRPLLSLRDEVDRKAVVDIAERVAELAKSLGGVMSGEHGDGRARGPLLESYFGPELMRAFREVKAVFDPDHLLNPCNIVEPAPTSTIVERTRVRPEQADVAVPAVDTYFDYKDQTDFGHAIEMCNGAGVCRKTSGGTMCPSYIATMDERHSTRGRGNALRLAITGQLGSGGSPAWDDAETKQTLDLCLSCKACKTECPSNVDISRLKAEYAAQGFDRGAPVPLQSRVFANVRALNRLGALTPGLANTVNALPPVRSLINTVLGFAPQRSLPRFERRLSRSLAKPPAPDPAMPTVLLFGDCFCSFNETSIGHATARVLGSFGYRVVLADAGCCGRPQVSTGLLGSARSTMDRTASRLLAAVRRESAVAVLVAEPSCLSALTDDLLELRLKAPIAERRRLAELCALPEQFLASRWDKHPRRPGFRPPAGRVLLHGHCHQKALLGIESSAAALRRAFGDEKVVPLDTGCCGMAGSFGFTAERYELSMKIGELGVFPAARELAPGDVFAAPGTSCRHQVLDGVGITAMHPIEVLSAGLSSADRPA